MFIIIKKNPIVNEKFFSTCDKIYTTVTENAMKYIPRYVEGKEIKENN